MSLDAFFKEQPRQLWLLLGSVAGYGLLMWTNPIRNNLRDAVRALQRYPALWLTLGLCGCAYATFHLAAEVYLAVRMPEEALNGFVLFRTPFEWDAHWWYGSETSFWYLPTGALRQAGREALGPALESTAGLFNNLVSTFPLAALAGLLLWTNWKGHQGVLWRALRKRFGIGGSLLHGFVLLCAAAAMMKPVLYFYVPPIDPELQAKWSPVVGWLAFGFEYVVGVGIQIYLILLSYCWVRGITFSHEALVDVAIRRFSYVVRWAAVVMLLSTAFIDLPLTLRNFPPFEETIPSSPELFERRMAMVRLLLAGALLVFATVQITLTFHSESLGRGLLDHVRFVARHGWALAWLMIMAGVHFYLLHLANLLVMDGVGEHTGAAIAWGLVFPWVSAVVSAWLLAAWVGVFRRADSSRSTELSEGGSAAF